ncbi:uncharacterized protein A1O9_09094 [Exophiala aquamarina CBS 119918]|uniref:Uncharacterized protein n=1 Tax=Exophiala aquamarina CBS 119918 TaxID=1182545 RepID=A0A072P4L2_9EURO|nr:uncharacterized protein A1O9_09094 [Exophiala aquamarina CBS 119918]KEF54652.1 hypothetical protein A1O9_09094 [Exophiala aquamarina CBS 119918]
MRRLIPRAAHVPKFPRPGRCWLSTGRPGLPQQAPKLDGQAATRSRFDRLIHRTPRFLKPTLTGLRDAPVSHISAFFILHEVTAVVPLFGLAGAFHYWNWLPPYFAEGAWVSAGVEKFGRYARKKGWISEKGEAQVEEQTKHGNAEAVETRKMSNAFKRGEETTRWIVEFATAYAVVKAFIPLRIVVSVWASPWFARWTIIPIGKAARNWLTRKP